MTTNKKNIGVIVGRFQVHKLTEGHREILDYVLAQNHKVNILVLGNSPADVCSTKNNPLPYLSRRKMIEDAYPDKFVICYKTDVKHDDEWSNGLDKLILSNTEGQTDVVLYGSRDSFIEHYKGKFECHEYQQKVTFSGSKLRLELGRDIGTSEDFRKGCIYATQHNWTTYYPTVDCAIFANKTFRQVYLAKKKGDNLFLFPGGFVDKIDENYEVAAIREAEEETNLKCSIHEYLGSYKIDDWRYRNEQESIMTSFYAMLPILSNNSPTALDDISELHLCNIEDLSIEDINPAHRSLFERVVEYSINQNNVISDE